MSNYKELVAVVEHLRVEVQYQENKLEEATINFTTELNYQKDKLREAEKELEDVENKNLSEKELLIRQDEERECEKKLQEEEDYKLMLDNILCFGCKKEKSLNERKNFNSTIDCNREISYYICESCIKKREKENRGELEKQCKKQGEEIGRAHLKIFNNDNKYKSFQSEVNVGQDWKLMEIVMQNANKPETTKKMKKGDDIKIPGTDHLNKALFSEGKDNIIVYIYNFNLSGKAIEWAESLMSKFFGVIINSEYGEEDSPVYIKVEINNNVPQIIGTSKTDGLKFLRKNNLIPPVEEEKEGELAEIPNDW